MDIKVTAEGVRADTHLEGWRERIPDCRSCNTETATLAPYYLTVTNFYRTCTSKLLQQFIRNGNLPLQM